MPFPSRQVFRNALAPFTKSVVENIGSKVSVKRAVRVRKPDNSSSPSWPVIAQNVPLRISQITFERLQDMWGADASVTAEGICTDSRDIQEDDVIVVTSGDYLGQAFGVLQVKPSPLSGALVLALGAPHGVTGSGVAADIELSPSDDTIDLEVPA